MRTCLSEEQQKLDADGGIVIPSMHNSVAPGLGKIGVLVVLKSDAPVDKLSALGKQIAMHVAATAPQSLRIEDLDPVSIESCLLYTSPSPRDVEECRMPSSA